MKTLMVAVAVLALWPMHGGKEYHMTAASVVPAANGTVQVQKDKNNGNTKLDVKVKSLANPANLTPSANMYIVWVRPSDGEAQKEGVIRVDANPGGELNATTTAKSFDIFITAEQSESVTVPSDLQILHVHIDA